MEDINIPNFTGDTNPFMPCLDNKGNYKADVHVNYMQVVPDSHFWTDLNQILESIKHHYYIMSHEPKENEYIQEPYLTKEYILIGLKNCMKNGYKLKVNPNDVRIIVEDNPLLTSIEEMIEFVENRPFELKFDYLDFENIIKDTLDAGINLTNGCKMERREIYNRIDGERNYQDENWGSRRQMDGTPDEEKPVAEWINYIEYHISKAKERVYHLDTLGATHELRKVAALAVRAMEIHGCPERIVVKGTDESICTCTDCECKKTE
jgi:hypothetical protein